jgi:TusA-related sulfurtransferase
MKLTKNNVKTMLPGQVLTIVCSDAAELDSVSQTAYQAIRELKADGNNDVSVSTSAKTLSVVIRHK